MTARLEEKVDELLNGKIDQKEAFLAFLDAMKEDYLANPTDWDNTTIAEYMDAMKSWIENFSACEWNDIDWDKLDYAAMARILYMGRIYE